MARVGQALAGEGVDGGNGVVELGVPGGARQPLGQGDDGGEIVPHGIVQLGGHSGLVPGGIALRHEPVLGGLGGELGVPVLQGLPAGPGAHRRGDDDGDQEDLRRDPFEEICAVDHDQGKGPASENHEWADDALDCSRNGEHGVEGHQRGEHDGPGRRSRSPQVHARGDQTHEDDGRQWPAPPAEQGRDDEQAERQQRPEVSPGLGGRNLTTRDEQLEGLEQARYDRDRPQADGGRAPPGRDAVQGGPRNSRCRGPRGRAHETRAAARRNAIVRTGARVMASAVDLMNGRARAARRSSVVDARLFAAVLTEPWDPIAAPARTAGPEAVTRGVLPRADGPASRMARRTRPSAPVAVRLPREGAIRRTSPPPTVAADRDAHRRRAAATRRRG